MVRSSRWRGQETVAAETYLGRGTPFHRPPEEAQRFPLDQVLSPPRCGPPARLPQGPAPIRGRRRQSGRRSTTPSASRLRARHGRKIRFSRSDGARWRSRPAVTSGRAVQPVDGASSRLVKAAIQHASHNPSQSQLYLSVHRMAPSSGTGASLHDRRAPASLFEDRLRRIGRKGPDLVLAWHRQPAALQVLRGFGRSAARVEQWRRQSRPPFPTDRFAEMSRGAAFAVRGDVYD